MTANRAAAFAFSSLKPGTCYTVQILGADPQEESPGTPLRSSFTTMPENLKDSTDFKFLTVSCNDISCSVTGTTNAWEALWDVVQKGDIKFLAHIGDQIYSDSGLHDVDRAKMETWQTRIDLGKPQVPYAEAIGMLQDLPRDAAAWEARRNDICEAYRRVYRATWSDPFTKRVLATVPNVMVTDDHDLRDDWGDLNGVAPGQELGAQPSTSDLQPTSPAFFIGSCALQVCNEYQRALREDPSVPYVKEHHYHVYGRFGFMFSESRSCKTFFRNPALDTLETNSAFFGAAQWRDMEEALSPGGTMEEVKCLIFFSPTVVSWVGTLEVEIAMKVAKRNDPQGSLDYKPFAGEQLRLLNMLLAWKRRDPSRELAIIAGDVHMSGFTNLFEKSAGFAFQQIVTSAVRCTPATAPQMLVIKGLLGANSTVGSSGEWTNCQFQWQRFNNFLVTKVERMPIWHRRSHSPQLMLTHTIYHASKCCKRVFRSSSTLKSTNHSGYTSGGLRCFCIPACCCPCLPK